MSAFIDFEASAAIGGYPIEVGFCLVNADRSLSSGSKLIRCDEWLDEFQRWSWEAEQIHHISRANIIDLGEAPATVMAWLNASLNGLVVCADSPYDALWCRELADAAGIPMAFRIVDISAAFEGPEIDEVKYDRLARMVSSPVAYGREFGRGLDQLAQYGIMPKTHRAGEDAEHLASWYVASLLDRARVHRLHMVGESYERTALPC